MQMFVQFLVTVLTTSILCLPGNVCFWLFTRWVASRPREDMLYCNFYLCSEYSLCIYLDFYKNVHVLGV